MSTSDLLRGAPELARRLRSVRLSAATRFATARPSPQTAVDAAPGAWVSRFPSPFADVRAGEVDLFEDERIAWGLRTLGGVEGASVLELGPLEGGHSYMAQQAGAARVVAVEANREAFLKCLIVKEIFQLDRCSFQCGDALDYLAQSAESFDLCIACGILYHLVDPVRLIELVSARAQRLLLWTHVYDERAIAGSALAKRIGPAQAAEVGGFSHRLHKHSYGTATHLTGFLGGTRPYSNWISREDLLGALEHFGWRDVQVAFDEPHPHGPALALTAVKSG
jgi:hypothetical protein